MDHSNPKANKVGFMMVMVLTSSSSASSSEFSYSRLTLFPGI
jgi:hypothetical protein